MSCDTRFTAVDRKGVATTSKISRRVLLFHSGSAVVASTVTATAITSEAMRQELEPSSELRDPIETHKVAYAVFGKAVYEIGGSIFDRDRASQAEEKALLALCAYPAVRGGDRLAKAEYLLEIEARGELDLPEHMQTLLRSTMWKA
ncbi:hypothetical protein FJ548_11320 [Mesorhizobium sp. B2-4-17]|nr:hypothetical protein FJ548_11320 [Mesorhizobium sp. B2-4-17]